VTPSGIETAIFQLVVRCLNRLHHRVPVNYKVWCNNWADLFSAVARKWAVIRASWRFKTHSYSTKRLYRFWCSSKWYWGVNQPRDVYDSYFRVDDYLLRAFTLFKQPPLLQNNNLRLFWSVCRVVIIVCLKIVRGKCLLSYVTLRYVVP